MRDPHVGAEVLQLVVLHVLLGVAHDLEDQLIAAVRQYEGTLVAQRGVEGVIQFVGIAPHELVFQLARGERLQSGGFGKRLQHRGLDPHHVAVHVGRPYRQSGNVAVIGDVILARGQRHVEIGQDELLFQLRVHRLIEQRELDQVVRIQHLARHANLLGHQAGGRDAAALAVAAVLHLDGRLVDELAAHRDGAGEPGDAAAAFFGALAVDWLLVAIHLAARGQKTIRLVAHGASSAWV